MAGMNIRDLLRDGGKTNISGYLIECGRIYCDPASFDDDGNLKDDM